MVVEFYVEDAPNTVNNFVNLVKEGYYDNTPFHRVIKGFMLQGGDPTGTGMGGPGYKFADEPVKKQYTKGTIAMANAGPNTNGSQFFIMHADYPLPPNYTIFGKVVEGTDVIDAIANVPVGRSRSGENSAPQEPVVLMKATISES
ncbi:MAG: peptidylprolyl isomerase [Thermomicrobiales bacterium]|nr:peptidylprolyl isomerase [Thermomicrobiales bacterium]MCO5218320.1 peptidylprolyl isomerase [Thermomicrobiales bacterium]MCO5223814.1 peptidylprolyl isomerase [Thermomicrobiales bacterium]MCO5228486.1 peptidylprolyl isomerase [Thermomicrobiales bacterium]